MTFKKPIRYESFRALNHVRGDAIGGDFIQRN